MITDEGTMYTCPKCQRHNVFIPLLTGAVRSTKTEGDISVICPSCSIRLMLEGINLLREYFGISLGSQAGEEAGMHYRYQKAIIDGGRFDRTGGIAQDLMRL